MENKFEYVIHVLNIKLWEWEAIKEKASTDMFKDPNEYSNRQIITANCRIHEIKDAIEKLNQP